MKLLKKLEPGDTIGIIAPSSGEINENGYYDYISKYLEERGYKVKLGKSFSAKKGYLAGPDELRINDIHLMFSDKEVKAIIFLRGGYGLSRIVDKLDYELIKNNPKIISGYSDITVLLNNVFQKCDFVTIHGLISQYLGTEKYLNDSDTKNDFINILTKYQKNRILKPLKSNTCECKTFIPGKCKGKLVGGNLSLISTLNGTPYEVDFTDKIVFIEDVGERPYAIDRYLCALRLRGALDKAKGFIFGYFTDCNPADDLVTVMDVLNDYILPLNKPTIINFTSGHEFPFVSLPIGAMVELDSDRLEIKICEEIYE